MWRSSVAGVLVRPDHRGQAPPTRPVPAPGRAVLVMADLVGFTAYTERCGDSSAHQASELLATAAEVELAGAGGRLVKPLGDGFLGALPPGAPAVDVLRRVRKRLVRPDGTVWAVHAGVRHGRPIQHRATCSGPTSTWLPDSARRPGRTR